MYVFMYYCLCLFILLNWIPNSLYYKHTVYKFLCNTIALSINTFLCIYLQNLLCSFSLVVIPVVVIVSDVVLVVVNIVG